MFHTGLPVLIQQYSQLAHERIQDSFQRPGDTLGKYAAAFLYDIQSRWLLA